MWTQGGEASPSVGTPERATEINRNGSDAPLGQVVEALAHSAQARAGSPARSAPTRPRPVPARSANRGAEFYRGEARSESEFRKRIAPPRALPPAVPIPPSCPQPGLQRRRSQRTAPPRLPSSPVKIAHVLRPPVSLPCGPTQRQLHCFPWARRAAPVDDREKVQWFGLVYGVRGNE